VLRKNARVEKGHESSKHQTTEKKRLVIAWGKKKPGGKRKKKGFVRPGRPQQQGGRCSGVVWDKGGECVSDKNPPNRKRVPGEKTEGTKEPPRVEGRDRWSSKKKANQVGHGVGEGSKAKR